VQHDWSSRSGSVRFTGMVSRGLVALVGTMLISAEVGAAAPPVPVTFRGPDRDESLLVQGPGIDSNAGVCGAACTLSLSPARYMVTLSSGGKTTSFDVFVQEPSDVVVSPANGFQRGLGLTLMIVGGSVFSIGALTLYVDEQSKLDDRRYGDVDPSYRYRSPDWVLPVEIAGGIGLGVALVGLPIFLLAHPTMKVLPRRTATAQRRTAAMASSRFRLAPSVGPAGAGMRVGWSF